MTLSCPQTEGQVGCTVGVVVPSGWCGGHVGVPWLVWGELGHKLPSESALRPERDAGAPALPSGDSVSSASPPRPRDRHLCQSRLHSRGTKQFFRPMGSNKHRGRPPARCPVPSLWAARPRPTPSLPVRAGREAASPPPPVRPCAVKALSAFVRVPALRPRMERGRSLCSVSWAGRLRGRGGWGRAGRQPVLEACAGRTHGCPPNLDRAPAGGE